VSTLVVLVVQPLKFCGRTLSTLLELDGPWRADSRSLEYGATGMFPLLMCVSFSSARESPQGSLEEVIREYFVAASSKEGLR
jgi:hypothetical protein